VGGVDGEPPLPGTDPDADPRALLREFTGLMHQQRLVLHRAFAREELHPGQAHCLRVLGQSDEIAQSALAELMVLSRPSVTRLLQRMERAGLIWRRTDLDDQRITRVGLTDAGRRRLARMSAVLDGYTGATLARLPENDRRQLSRLLRAWRELADDVLAGSADAAGAPDVDPPEGHVAASRGSVNGLM
jgi:MarR family transcriptional regulator, organic hydroperoxide resistance regulator